MKLRQEIGEHRVAAKSVTLWWLGQAGYILKSPGGKTIVLDPYLTNSCKEIGEEYGFNMDRLVPPPLEPRDLVGLDCYLMTHSHGDHLDPQTLGQYREAGGNGPYIAPHETVEKLKTMGIAEDRIETTWPNKKHTIGDLTVRTTFAIPLGPDDLTHVGFVIGVTDGPTIYFTGDTGYHDILADAVAPDHPDVLVTVINGTFNNLSPAEATRLAKRMDVGTVIPCHYDLFPDSIQSPEVLHTNLKLAGIGDRYKRLEHGSAYTYTKSH